MDLISILLTTLKFAGVVVSGIAGVIATQPARPSRKTLRLIVLLGLQKAARDLFNKHQALRLVIIGFAVALLSQFLETFKTASESRVQRDKDLAAQANTSNQLWLARQTLDGLDRSLNQIHQSLSVEVVFELLYTNKTKLEILADGSSRDVHISLNQLKDYLDECTAAKTKQNLSNSPIKIFRLPPYPIYSVRIDRLLEALSANSQLQDTKAFLSEFADASIRMHILPEWSTNDAESVFSSPFSILTCHSASPLDRPQLYYAPFTKRIFVRFGCEVPTTNWFINNVSFLSVPDIAQGHCYVASSPVDSDLIRPVIVRLIFDNYAPITSRTLRTYIGTPDDDTFETELPGKAEILKKSSSPIRDELEDFITTNM